MGTIAKLRTRPGDTPPPRTPEREALAAAIADRDRLAADVEQTRQLLTEAESEMSKLAGARRRAHQVAETAREKYSAHALDLRLGKVSEIDAPLSPPAARRRLEDAEDAAEIQRAVCEGINNRLGEQKTAHSFAADRVRRAALHVLGTMPDVQSFAAETARLQRELMARSITLMWLSQADLAGRESEAEEVRAARQLVNAGRELHSAFGQLWLAAPREEALGVAKAAAALMVDADAQPAI